MKVEAAGPILVRASRGGRVRTVYGEVAGRGLSGPVELIDNNPLICAEEFEFDAADPVKLAFEILEMPLVRSQLLEAADCRHRVLAADGPWTTVTLEADGLDIALCQECYEEAFDRRPAVILGWLDPRRASQNRIGPAVIGVRSEGDSTISLTFHRDGRIGPCGVVQTLNVMFGFDELSGLSDCF